MSVNALMLERLCTKSRSRVCGRGLQSAFGFGKLLHSGTSERGLKPATTYLSWHIPQIPPFSAKPKLAIIFSDGIRKERIMVGRSRASLFELLTGDNCDRWIDCTHKLPG